MRFLGQLAVASALTTIVSAHPTLPKRGAAVVGSSKFTVTQAAPKTPGRKLAGPIALANALGKYHRIGGTAPAVVKAAAAKAAATDDGTVSANPQQYDAEYLESVSVGGQTLNLDFDTGSSDLWVFSNELPSNDQSGHNIYTPGSSANKLSGETWSISYGDGSSASGDVYTDSVDVGGTTVTTQAVELASTISAQFVQDPSDGLLGLGFSSINTVTPDQQKTFFDNAQSGLASPLFTANLLKGAPGSYNFGYVDDTEHTGSVTYVPVDNSNGFWGYTTDSYTVGSGTAVTGSVSSIADTGTSLLLTDDTIVSAYYAQVASATNSQTDGGYVFDCTATLPDISFSIGGYTATVPGSYINYAPASASGTCFGGIQSNAGIGFSIFGDIFLKSQFVVFSASGPQLGFAPKNV